MEITPHRRRVLHGPALRAIREAIGISQSQLAGDVGISASYLTNLEAGRKQPSPELARRLADRLTVDVTAFSYLPRPWPPGPPAPRPVEAWDGGPLDVA
jgi:transcriptional regulator with XRE-family HTH domain